MEKEPITVEGLEKLKKELIILKEKKRPEIVAAIAENKIKYTNCYYVLL